MEEGHKSELAIIEAQVYALKGKIPFNKEALSGAEIAKLKSEIVQINAGLEDLRARNYALNPRIHLLIEGLDAIRDELNIVLSKIS